MEKTPCLAALALIFSGLLYVTQASQSTRWVFASTTSPTRVPISIQKEADIITLPLSIACTKDTPDKRIRDLIQAAKTLKKKIKDDSNICLITGQTSYSDGKPAGLPYFVFNDEFKEDRRIKTVASLTFHIAVSPRFESTDLLDQAAELTRFADNLILGSPELYIGQIMLGTRDPQQYRAQLQKNIMEEMARLRELAGMNAILHISGLEGPVEARQVDNQNVELFINYQLTLEQWGSKDPASFPNR